MNSKLFLSVLVGGTLALTSCNKKLNEISAEYFTVNPSPLEVVAGKVPATVTGQIPEKFFVKNAEVTVTPYLVYGDKETASQAYKFIGEDVNGNGQTVSYDNGGTVTVPVSFDYVPEMIKSELVLDFQVVQGKKSYTLPRIKVADGVIATATFADAGSVTPATTPDKFQRIINEQYNAEIKFLINQSNVRKSETESQQIADFNSALANAQGNDRLEIEEVNIKSYASPDGKYDFNERLAQKREDSTRKYLNKSFKNNDIKDFGELTADFTAEDWEGFKELVSASDIQDKDLILSVLSMYNDPEQREKEIRNLSSVFEQLAEEILPQLRRSRLTASINVIGKSDEEIMAVFNSDPDSLTVEELLYCGTLTDDNAKRIEIYTACTKYYPNDYRGYNNLGMCQYIAGDYDAAKSNFNKAANLAPESAETHMNQALCDMMDKNYDSANQKLGSAAGVEGLNEALGVYYMEQGDYNAAVNAFGDAKSNNAALAQILTKDYSKARNTLATIAEPDATTYYLMAVLGARTNNQQMVTSNLSQAISKDSTLRDKAANDLEFAKFDISSVL